MGAVNFDFKQRKTLSPGGGSCHKYFNTILLSLLALLVLASSALVRPGTASADISVEITGDGVTTPTVISQVYLESMPQVQAVYSTINTWPTKKFYAARGVRLVDLLKAAGIKDEARTITVESSDGFKMTFTRKELLEDTRYFYPGLKDNHEYFGYIPGSPDGAIEVDTILALTSAEGSDDPGLMTGKEAPLLVMGQRWVTEQTNSVFVKYVKSIEVSTAAPVKWESPKADPAGGTVAAGARVELSTSDMDGDNIHYTTDGSDPTYKSPMYNWIKKRWWEDRAEELADINHPVDVNRNMMIKAVTIGFGREDSDIVTFEYKVPLAAPPVLIADTDDNVVGREVDITFTDNPDWREAITGITVNGGPIAGRYTVTAGNINIDAGVFTAAGDYVVAVKAAGYEGANVIQPMIAAPSTVTLDSPSDGQEFKQGQTVPILGIAGGIASLSIEVNGPLGEIVYGPLDIVTVDGKFETSFSLSSSADTGIYSITLKCLEIPAPFTSTFKCVTSTGGDVPEGNVVLTITGDGVTNTKKFTREQLQDMDQHRLVYSAINTWPTKKWYVGEGVKLRDLLQAAGMKSSAQQLRFTSADGFHIDLTVKELLNDTRYYFPMFKDGISDADGHVPGSAAGAVEVEPLVALLGVEGSDDPGYMSDLNTPLLMLGQRAVTEQNGNLFVKMLSSINVTTTSSPKWDEPVADPTGGDVEAGTLVRLNNNKMDDDKIYYTTDGSNPTIDSPMYNWVASRWWGTRGDGVVESINKPVVINAPTTIKAVTIGPGRQDSSVVTFKYQVKEAPSAVSGTAGKDKLSVIRLGSEAEIELPPGTLLDDELEVKIEKASMPAALPAGYKQGSGIYEFSIGGEYNYSFAGAVTIKLRFDPTLVGAAETLAIFYYDEALEQWVKLGGSVADNTISVQVDHFTKFAVLIYDPTVVEPVQIPEIAQQHTPGFTDIAGHWAASSINRLRDMGAVSGYVDGSFKPDHPITRAEFIMILVKAFHLEGKSSRVFDDTGGHWAKDFIAVAATYGIASGYSEAMFGPDDCITREQMAVMICKAARIPYLDEEIGFADWDGISEWARGAVSAAAGKKIINGYPDNTFQPIRNATRAEAVTVILNALDK